MKTNVVVFGEQPFASWLTDQLIASDLFIVLGVVCNNTRRDYSHHQIEFPSAYEYVKNNDLRILSEKEAVDVAMGKEVLGITARWSRLLPEEVVSSFTLGILNCHGGYLPRWRGLNIPTHVITEGSDYSGATLHFLDKDVDTGPILARKKFPVDNHCTAYDVFLRTQQALQELVSDNLRKIKAGKEHAVSQESLLAKGEEAVTYYSTNQPGRALSIDDSQTKISRMARAYEFPGYERAYLLLGNKKIYLTPERTSSTRSASGLSDPFSKPKVKL